MKIVVYSTSTCPKCKILKTKLANKKINFIEELLDDTTDERVKEIITRLNIMSVPVLEVDGKIISQRQMHLLTI